jgi:PAS domain S-box-containing protein
VPETPVEVKGVMQSVQSQDPMIRTMSAGLGNPDKSGARRLTEKSGGKPGVRIATLSRVFVVFLVFMTFGIVGITLTNVGAGKEIVDRWQLIEHQNVIKYAKTRRIDMANLVNNFRYFQIQFDEATAEVVLRNIGDLEREIRTYDKDGTNNTEMQALLTIGNTLMLYRDAIATTRANSFATALAMNVSIRLHEATSEAITAVKLLKAAQDRQRDIGISKMQTSVEDMMSVLYIIAITSSIAAAVIGAIIWWLSDRLLISPLLALRHRMMKLADGYTGAEMQPDETLTDIREMAASVEVFRRNLIEAEQLRKEDKLAQQRIRIFSQAIDQSPASVVLVDPDKCIQYFNPRFCDVLGFAPKEIMGQKFSTILDRDIETGEVDNIWSSASQTGGWSGEILGRAKNGEKIWVLLVVSPVRDHDDNISHFLVVMEDMSQRKEFETQLIEAKETAELAYRSKTEFLANMTHELRTPLNAIIGFSEIIKGEMLGPIEQPSYLEYSNDIFESGKHLLGLIEDILDYSRIEAGKQDLVEAEFDLLSAINLSRKIAGGRAKSQDISIRLDMPGESLRIRADERKTKQILLNLISNAVKFSHDGGEVIVGARIESDASISLFVRDQGIGIAPEDVSIAMAPFGQVESNLNRAYEGTGLGLPLSRSLAEAHGGTMTLDSALGNGTTVTVNFPRERNLQFVTGDVADCA